MKVFVEGTSIYKKISALLLLIFILGLIIGAWSNVIILQPWMSMFTYMAWGLSLVVWLLLIKKRKWVYSVYDNKRTKYSKWSVVVSFILIVPLLTHFFVGKGLPSILHFFSSKNSVVLTLTVKDLGGFYNTKYCRGRMTVKEFEENLIGLNEFCIKNESFWSSLEVNDKIKVQGSISIFGFTYDRFERH